MEWRLDKNKDYYCPFEYKDPVLGTIESSYLLKSDSHYIYYVHPYTYQFLKAHNRLAILKNFQHFSSMYSDVFDQKAQGTDYFNHQVLFCRDLPITYVKGKKDENIGSEIPSHLFDIDLPPEMIHHIDIIFELYHHFRLFYFKKKSTMLEWVVYASCKISILPLSQNIKETLFNKLCEVTLTSKERKNISLTIHFYSERQKQNHSYYELIKNTF